MTDLLLHDVEVQGRVTAVRLRDGAIAEIGAQPATGAGDEQRIDGRGGALLPGLHDHHIHLLATAAARQSVQVGPPQVRGPDELAAALRAADTALPAGSWLRAVGYHASVGGDLDRAVLDRLVPGRPARVQDRSGARWTLNSAAIAALDLEEASHPGIERDDQGRATGRLHRVDDWLRAQLPPAPPPGLADLGSRLAALGVTGVTDATPYRHLEDLDPIAAAASGDLPQRVVVTGGVELAGCAEPTPLEWGPVKIIVDDAAYPSLDDLADGIATAHRHGRPAAIHCVTRAALVLALAAWDVVGAHPGDRVEHGAVVPPELVAPLSRHGLTVVTQPSFVAERGQDYLRDVEPDDLPHLYPCARLLDAGVAVAGSSDGPYSDLDPWAAMRAATLRRSGDAVVGAAEAVHPEQALALYLGAPHRPGAPRPLAVGGRADLCLLDRPLADVLRRLGSADVALTICAGRVVHDAR